jgi:hypothetical protein
MRLDGSVAIVTGGGWGIRASVAYLCCQQSPIRVMWPAGCTRGSDLQADQAAQWRPSWGGDRTAFATAAGPALTEGLVRRGIVIVLDELLERRLKIAPKINR